MEKIHLTEVEVKQIEELQKAYNEITGMLGRIEMQMLTLSNSKQEVVTMFKDTQNKENEFGNMLKYKYGEGFIDMNEKVFIPKEEK